jgi:6-phosphogluconate dehydrogenase (decarboxylating)
MITQHSSIGFIALGAMGQRLARRLLDNGFKLIAYDHTSHKTIALAAYGAMPAPSVSPTRNEIGGDRVVPAKRRSGSERLKVQKEYWHAQATEAS